MMPYTADSRPASASDFGACTGWYLIVRPFQSKQGVSLVPQSDWYWQSLLHGHVTIEEKALCRRSASLLADQAATNSAGIPAQSKVEPALLQAKKLCLDLTCSCVTLTRQQQLLSCVIQQL